MLDTTLGSRIMYERLYTDEQALHTGIRQARAYAAGDHYVKLTDRMRRVLGNRFVTSDADMLRLNACHTVLKAVNERLSVRGFSATDQATADWCWRVWQANRMDAQASQVHYGAGRDGEYSVLVTWDNTLQRPSFHPHPRYVEGMGDVEHDNHGIRVFYQDDDVNAPVEYATKRWLETVRTPLGNGRFRVTTRRRITFFFPDRIEKYEEQGGKGGTLVPMQDPQDVTWPLANIHRDGTPLGVLVAHIRNPGMDSDIKEAIPLQNALNKAVVDVATAADMTAMRVLFARGWYATTDGTPAGEPLPIEPGIIYSTGDVNADLKAIDGADMSGLMAVVDHYIGKIAQVTDTPISRFITTAQVSSAASQKEGESPLIGKIEMRQAHYGNGWEDAMRLARRLHNTYSSEPEMDEAIDITCEWKPAVVRDETQELARAETKQRLGIPQRQIWLELGYSQEQVDAWGAERAEREQRQMEMDMQQAQVATRGQPPAITNR